MSYTRIPIQAGEPVAIIGVGCRFPGAPDLESFWRILRDGIETVGDYPGGRFPSVDSFYDATAGKRNGMVTRRGGFLKEIDLFDADFFGISPREAILLDPQQRLLLELGWEGLEDAGLPLSAVAGSRTGVFVGQWTSDFEACLSDLAAAPNLYSITGSGRYAASARLAYHFDLRGPNLTVDTACSSASVAVHLACQSLRSGESELALAGGVNLILRPEITFAYGAAGMLSQDGRCKFGDASADGYVRSEAGGVVVLKLLRHALVDRDSIHAVIRGTSVNNDGHSSGLLVSPSREGQAAMIRSALQDAGITARELDYIEAHGTGTAAGDPVELEAIGTVLGEIPRERPCLVGSAKTNVGHPEAAAGMVGLCKLILALERGIVPASLHFREPNPQIPWSTLPLKICGETQPWPHRDERRIAGLNSFGITGTNAHVILQNAPARISPHKEIPRPRLFLLSARTPAALEQTAASWRSRLNEESPWRSSMADLAYTAAVRRSFHECRLAVTAKDAGELDAQLASWLASEPAEYVDCGNLSNRSCRCVFVFPGQGGQWAGMGRELFEEEPAFRDAVLASDRALRPHTGWSVVDEIVGPAASSEIDRVQPALFTIMIAIAELWRSWGVTPEAVVGHSMGEVAAAVVCGALSLEDGAAVIAKRSRLMKKASGRGLMAMVALPLKDAEQFVEGYNGRVSIAANNSPSSTILSGDADVVEEAIALLESREVFCRRIHVDVASHCAQMDPIAPRLELDLAFLTPRRASLPLYSTSTGRVEDGLSLGARYWGRNLREPVLFADAVQHLICDGFGTFVEINAHPVLLSAIEDGAKYAGTAVLAVPSLRRDKEQRREILASLGKIHVSGHPVDFRGLYPTGECLRLPSYPWQRERYWPDQNQSEGNRFGARRCHSQLGVHLESSMDPDTHLWDIRFSPPDDGLEAAGWCLDLVVEASSGILDAAITFEDIRFRAVAPTTGSGQLVLSRRADRSYRFTLSAKTGAQWTIRCEGNLHAGDIPSSGLPAGRCIERMLASTTESCIASLQTAAELVGYDFGDEGWSVSGIDRVEFFPGLAADQLRMRGTSGLVNQRRTNVELARTDGSPALRLLGIQFEFSPGPDCERDIYEWKWIPITVPGTQEDPGGAFVVMGDTPTSSQIATHLCFRGFQCLVVSDAASVPLAVESLNSPLRGVVWTSAERTSLPESAVEAVSNVCSLVQSVSVGDSTPPGLWLVTTGAHSIEGAGDSEVATDPSASQAAVWGLGRVIACEHPEMRCINVDLGPCPDSEEFDLLSRLVTGNPSEELMAIRRTTCYGRRLQRRRQADKVNLSLREDGTYLITGGFGALGLALATFLVKHGARDIALVGRRAPSEDATKTVAFLESQGARVRGFEADVAISAVVASVLKEIGENMSALRGVFHLAGVTQDALVKGLTRDSLHQVMRPKVFGAWNLHHLTADANLDYFVMYSSLAAVSSQPGQGSYAASNAYLDGLATIRQVRGLPGVSIQWGPWDEAGMIRESGASRSRSAWSDEGIRSLSTEAALESVYRLLARPVPVAFVAAIDWERFVQSRAGRVPPVCSELVASATRTEHVDGGIRERLRALNARERLTALESLIRNFMAAVLKTKASRIHSSNTFGSLGVDSLIAVEIARRISDALLVRLPVTAVFNFPTLELLVKEVSRRLALEQAPALEDPPEAQGTTPKPFFPAIAQMTEEEAVLSLLKPGQMM